jgi:hypothetical protein
MRIFIKFFLTPISILILSIAMGLAFGILPCYVFPLLGANAGTWCGLKSEPKYFFIQVSLGFLLMMGFSIYAFYFRRRGKS